MRRPSFPGRRARDNHVSEDALIYIIKFNNRLIQATRETVMAVERNDVSTAINTARRMAQRCLELTQEAIGKAQGAFIAQNAELYYSLASTAQAFADAGIALVQAGAGDGTYSEQAYRVGAHKLAVAFHQMQ